jgi:hypothetical protein
VVVPGVTPDKWSLVWSQRLPEVDLRLVPVEVAAQATTIADAAADAGLVRLPVDRDVFDAIPLYTETTVVVVGRDHVSTVAEEVTVADLAGETLLVPLDDVLAWTEPASDRRPRSHRTRPAGHDRRGRGTRRRRGRHPRRSAVAGPPVPPP